MPASRPVTEVNLEKIIRILTVGFHSLQLGHQRPVIGFCPEAAIRRCSLSGLASRILRTSRRISSSDLTV